MWAVNRQGRIFIAGFSRCGRPEDGVDSLNAFWTLWPEKVNESCAIKMGGRETAEANGMPGESADRVGIHKMLAESNIFLC